MKQGSIEDRKSFAKNLKEIPRACALGLADFAQSPYDISAKILTGSFVNASWFFKDKKLAAEARIYRLRLGIAAHSALLAHCLSKENYEYSAMNAIVLLAIGITNSWTKKRMQQLLCLEPARKKRMREIEVS
jgi:hypothetical protein